MGKRDGGLPRGGRSVIWEAARGQSGSVQCKLSTNRKIRDLFNQYRDRDKEIDVDGEWLFVTIHTAHGPENWMYPAP